MTLETVRQLPFRRAAFPLLVFALCWLTQGLVASPAGAATYAYDDTIVDTPFDPTTTNVIWDQTCTDFNRDDDKTLVTIGFTFNFAGIDYTQVRIMSNGALHFGADQNFQTDYTNEALPITTTVNGPCAESPADRVIAPYWDDLQPGSGGTVRYDTLGSAPNRRFAVSWTGVPLYPNTGSYTFQVVLYEGSNNILFRYGGGNTNGSGTTIGVEVNDTDFTQYSYNTSSVTNGDTILFYPTKHFAISHDGAGDICQTENVTITYHNPDHSRYMTYTGTITLSTSTGNGTWSLGSGALGLLTNLGGGSATYTFAAGENGLVNLGFSDPTPETVNINLTDGTSTEDPGEDANLVFTGAANTIRDDFNVTSFANNDGTLTWATDWIEVDGNGMGPGTGNVLITGGDLSLDDQPNTNGEPSLEREADLSTASSAILSFDYQTTSGVDNSDSIILEVSANGGVSWTTLEDFTGINGATSGSRSYDLTTFLSANTRIRFRVANAYGGGNENFLVNFVQIATPQPCAHFAINHDGAGDSCAPENVTFEVHNGSHVLNSSYSGSASITTTTAHGDWSVVVGNISNLTNFGNGMAIYTFDGTEGGTITLGLANTFTETLNIDISDGSLAESSTEDADLIFAGVNNPDTYRDEFNAQLYSNNDGSLNWSTDWLEINDDGDPTGSDERILTDLGADFSLRVRDNNNGGEGVEREADLSTFTAATLTFDYRRNSLDDANDYVAVWASGDGGTSWTELPGSRLAGPTNDAAYQSASFDLTPYIAVNTRIRFLSSADLGNNDQVYFDNIEISDPTLLVCAGADHYAISHDGTAINCQAEPITIRAHDATHIAIPGFTGTIDLTTDSGNGDWTVITGVMANLTNNGNGSASYIFDGSENGLIVLGLKDTFVESVNIDITDGTATEQSGTALVTEDQDLVFAAAGFNFLVDGLPNPITTQIGGKPSNTAPGSHTLELQAIRTSDQTGACEAALVGNNTIELAFECIDPTTCTTSQVLINATAIAGNPDSAVAAYTGVSLDFGDDTDTTATFTMSYPDSGRLRLHARYDIPLGDGSPSTNLMVGNSNDFVVRPFGIDLVATGNPGATLPTGLWYTTAGSPFTVTARAVLWQADDDTNTNGLPDNHADLDPTNNANLADNSVALNFGREIAPEDVSLSSLLYLPVGGSDPGLLGSITLSGFINGTSSNAVRFDEVGIIEITAALSDGSFLGDANVRGKSGPVGRFSPATFNVTVVPDPPTLFDSCPGGSFTYLGESFPYTIDPILTITAQNTAGATTLNYDCGGFWMLPTPYVLNYSYADSSGGGTILAPLVATKNPSAGDSTNCDGLLSLTINDTFTYTRPSIISPLPPFASAIDFTADLLQFTDSDGICYDAGTGCQALTRSNISGATLRHGRLKVFNNYGPETADIINSPFATQYYDGTSWMSSSTDVCTTSMSFCPAARIGAGTVLPDPLVNGAGTFTVTTTGVYGEQLDVCPLAPAWLTELVDCVTPPAPDDTCGLFSFGIYRGNDRIINWKEIIR
ncbi:MAG: hypothetical protein KJ950_12095 [Proteobacteria bacterium]|nr:hypothetical protein [Pseudomonadota bacterium]MBU1688073.1 hypothetical protein [Pseudomonadota bacterium]